jgi:hypothetical protein
MVGDIRGALLTVDGVRLDPEGITVATAMKAVHAHPRIFHDGEHFVVVWAEQADNPQVKRGVRAARLRSDGVVVDGPAPAGTLHLTDDHQRKDHLSLARLGGDLLVVWDEDRSQSGIRGMRFRSDGSLVDHPTEPDGVPLGDSTESGVDWPEAIALSDRVLLLWLGSGPGPAPAGSLRASLLFPW